MVDGLLGRGPVTRQAHPGDRRRVTLAPTASGQAIMESALEITRSRLAERLAPLPQSERVAIAPAMQAIRPVFVADQELEVWTMYKRILVPLDGSQFAERVLPQVEALAEVFAATVTLVQVTPSELTLLAEAMGLEPALIIDPTPLIEAGRNAAETYLAPRWRIV